MALAILELIDADADAVRFNIDTGTNRYYQLKAGRGRRRDHGLDWIDEVTYTSPVHSNPDGGALFHQAREITLAASQLPERESYVQLFSFKSPDGRASTFSEVVPVHGRFSLPPQRGRDGMRAHTMSGAGAHGAPRRLPCATAAERYAGAASLDELLASVVRLATPLVSSLLGGGNGAAAPAAAAAPDPTLARVLAALLQAFGGGAAPALAGASSLGDGAANRFDGANYAHPFIFGIDDALIGALAGPVLQLLPQLMNAANQRQLQSRQADNRLVAGILSDVNRRLMLQQLAAAQPKAGSAADLARLLQLLQQAPADSAPAAAPLPAAQSMSGDDAAPRSRLSKRAVVDFLFGAPLPWNGAPQVLFVKGAGVRLKLQLTVGAPAPASALPKAILKLVFKAAGESVVRLEKTFRQKDLAANTPFTVEFSGAELAALPDNTLLSLGAELRWLGGRDGAEFAALGTRELVFVSQHVLKSEGAAAGDPLELTDMARFRPFWNKVWESPVLDAAGGAGGRAQKYLWELDVTAKYSVLLSAAHADNGLMEVKTLQAAGDPESLSEKTVGRLKSGIELGMAELNKLLAEWPGRQPLDGARLQALQTDAFVRSHACELLTHIKLQGKASERGMVWIVPVFQLVQCNLAAVADTDASGQVARLQDDSIEFPLPVAARVLALKSGTAAAAPGGGDEDGKAAPDYHFDGYQVVVSEKVALIPAAPPGRAA